MGQRHVPMPIIVGAPRSGTTLLRLMLDAHPDLAIPGETGFLLPVFNAIEHGVDLSAEQLISMITTFHTWRDLDTDADEYAAAVRALVPFTVTAGANEFFRMYAAARGKSRWGDKTPVYGQFLPPLINVLPDAHIIHIIRDGRDVAMSLRPTWFTPADDIPTIADYWATQVRTARSSGIEHYLEIRYEDLLSDTETTLRTICAFIDLPFDSAMLSYHRTAATRLSELQDHLSEDGSVFVTRERRFENHKLTSEPPNLSRAGRWRTEMTPHEQLEFHEAAGDLLVELGYPR